MKIKSLLFLVALAMSGFNSLYAAGNCVDEKARFKELYIALQQSLNYEGKDAYLDKGSLKLKAHDPNSPYEGKVFEAALNKEYTLALKKVGAIYQAAKFEDFEKSNPALIEFIKAVEGDDKAVAAYVKNNKVDQVIDELAEVSKKKFGGGKNPALITNNDKYLLKKLLTHAQDRICSVSRFEKVEKETGKQTRDHNFTAEELNLMRNAPLNRLVHSIKIGKLTADSDIKIEELKNSDMAINLAIAKNLQAIKDWKAKNEKCLKDIANPAFIQSNIQLCNYSLFVKALDKGNEDNLEAVLHFINANEKFLNKTAAIAETALDELKLEAAIDQAFNGIGKREACPVVKKVDSKIIINNLPYSEKGGFNKSGLNISCLKGKNKLDQALCDKSIEFVSNSTGEGLELKLKEKGSMSLSVETKNDCGGNNKPVSLEADKTSEDCKAEGEAKTPQVSMIVSLDKKSCIVAPNSLKLRPNEKTAEMCINEGQARDPQVVLEPSEDRKSCVEPNIDGEKNAEQCKAEGKKSIPPKLLVPSEDKKSCVESSKQGSNQDGLKTGEMCKAEGEKATPPKLLVPSEDKKSCVESSKGGSGQGGDKTAEMCKLEGEKSTPPKLLVPSEDKKSCVEQAAGKKTQADCDKESTADKKLKLNEEKNTCEPAEEKAAEERKTSDRKKSDEELCDEKNSKWIDEATDGDVRTNRYSWDSEANKCIDKQDKRSSSSAPEEDNFQGRPQRTYPTTPAPQRFSPIQVPTRQMYILPGMP